MAAVTGNEGARWGQERKKAATVERAALWRRPQCRHSHAELAAVEQDWVHAHDGEASGERTKSVTFLCYLAGSRMHDLYLVAVTP